MSDQPRTPKNDFDTPYDEDMERAVLGSVLINPDVFLTLAAFLNAEDFFLLRHQYIWEAMTNLSQRAEPIVRQSLRRELQDLEYYEPVGGDPYISELVSSTPTAMYAEHYGQLVERDAVRRRLLQTAEEIRGIAHDRSRSLEEALGESEAKLFNVSERRSQRDIISMREAAGRYFEQLESMMQQKDRGSGLPTGFKKLDALLGGLQRSDLLIFAGRPGMGKTSFMLSLALNAAQQFNARILLFSLEMGFEQLVQRFLSMETEINMQKLRTGNVEPHEQRRLVEALGRLSQLPIYIDDSPALSPVQMRTKCQRVKHEYGLDLIILDYIQLMHASGYNNNRVQEVSYISRHLKELAREMNVPLFSAAQLSRAVEQRADKRPQLSDLRESGCLAGESLVWLPDEGRYEQIQRLCGKKGFRVMSLNTETYQLEPATVTNAFHTGVKPVFKMTTALGRNIRATGNHKFYTIEGWKRLDELQPGDRIAIPRQLDHTVSRATMSDDELAQLAANPPDHLPDKLIAQPQNTIRQFLQYLWPENHSHIPYTTDSEQLAFDIQTLLLRTGINTAIQEQQPALATPGVDTPAHYHVNLVDNEHTQQHAESDVYWDKITDIEPDGEVPVYDITVVPNHCFVTNGLIASNSLEQDADIVMFLYRDIVYNEATEYPNQADVIVAKHRNGPTDNIPLYFDSSVTRFLDGTRRNVDLSTM